jgi:hypothetical protein
MDRDSLRSPDILWLDSAAERWLDAYPIGNGRLGVMVFGGHATETFADSIECVAQPQRPRQLRGATVYSRFTAARTRSN